MWCQSVENESEREVFAANVAAVVFVRRRRVS